MANSEQGRQRGSGGEAPGTDHKKKNRVLPPRPRGEPAVVALRMEELTLWVMERVASMPRQSVGPLNWRE